MVWDHNTARLAHETRIIWDGCAKNDLRYNNEPSDDIVVGPIV
jgi:hypothetical protein